MILFDTTVLIDLERETRRKTVGPATAYLRTILDERPAISVVTVGEFAEGFIERTFDMYAIRLTPYTVIPVDQHIAWQYAQISRQGRTSGTRIGDNDLWIAATALERGYPLLTRNTDHFNRISGLTVTTY